MRIGIFTDAYLPALNGISIVAVTAKEQLEAMGHEVIIFAPGKNLTRLTEEEPGVFRFPAVSGDRILFEDARISLFYPPSTVKKIVGMEFDVVLSLTPNIVGLLGIYIAKKHEIPLVQQYCTDIIEYAYRYPNTLPAIIASTILAIPIIRGLDYKQLIGIARGFTPRLRPSDWSRRMALEIAPYIYNQSDHIVAVSRKVQKSLIDMKIERPISIVPTGVTPVTFTKSEAKQLREDLGLKSTDRIILSLGRLSREKNLDLLIDMFDQVAEADPHAVLLFVGDFDYRPTLEDRASMTVYADRILFAGKIAHEHVGPVYAMSDIFVFPSLTDTQGLVIHEAVGAGLPVVMIDSTVTEVVKDGVNGVITNDSPSDFAQAVIDLLADKPMRNRFSAAGLQLIEEFTAQKQAVKLVEVFEKTIARKESAE